MTQYQSYESESSFRHEFFRRVNRAEKLIGLMSIIVAIVVSVSTFFGLQLIVGENGLHSAILPLIISAGVGAYLWMLWHILFRTAPLANKSSPQIIIASFLVLVTIVFSAWPVTTAISGDAAVTAHLNKFIVAAREYLRDIDTVLNKQSGIIDKIDIQSKKYSDMAAQEEATGVISGTRGYGAVSTTFNSISGNLRDVSKKMSDQKLDISDKKAHLLSYLSSMQHIVADSTESHELRQRKFADLAGKFLDLVESLQSLDFIAPLSSLSNSSIPYTSRNRQHQIAINDAQRTLSKDISKIQIEGEKIKRDFDFEKIKPFSPINPGIAVIKYYEDIKAGWAMAIGLDVMPLLLLFILYFNWQNVRKRHDPTSYDWGRPGDSEHTEPPLPPVEVTLPQKVN